MGLELGKKFFKTGLPFCLVFLIFYSCFGFFLYSNFGTPNNTNDFFFHYWKAKGVYSDDISWNYSYRTFEDYPPLFHLLVSPFAENPFSFYVSSIILICVFIPALLFFISKSFWVLPFYFMGISLPHYLIFGATFPFAFTLFLLLSYFLLREKFELHALAFFAVLALFSHHYGFELFLLMLVLEFFVFFAEKIKEKVLPVFYVLLPAKINSPQFFAYFFLFQISPVTSFFAFKGFNLFYFSVAIASFLFSGIDFRVSAVLQLCFILCAVKSFTEISWKKKLLALGLMSFSFGFVLLDYVLGAYNLAAFH